MIKEKKKISSYSKKATGPDWKICLTYLRNLPWEMKP